MKILVIGDGGREHALAWKLNQSSLVEEIFVAPGNPGTELIACNIAIEATNVKSLREFAIKENIDLTIVGPEAPIALGIADLFQKKGLKIFAPKKGLAQLESSKEYAKSLMEQLFVPTASFKVFSLYNKAIEYIIEKNVFPIVIKANGLAKGKGVRICKDDVEAAYFLQDLMIHKIHGDAGNYVVIEDYLEGEEYSVQALYDRCGNIKMLPLSKDYQDFNGAKTGGMGAIAPMLTESRDFLNELSDLIIKPIISNLNCNDSGCIYPGIIITPNGIKVLEHNMRFGDPELLVLLCLMKSDLAEVLFACVNGKLSEIKLEWHDGYAISVALVAKGYPKSVSVGGSIVGIEEAEKIYGVKVFHAGTDLINGRLATCGGRILHVTAIGETLEEARWRVYKAIGEIYFEGMEYRDDIGLELSPYQGT